ncbi:hypothetical protein QOT17_007375 [Balamuthia mandrillaris]
MAFYVFALLLLLAPQLNAQTCDCVACLDEAAVFSEETLYQGSCDDSSQIAVITELEVNSPDGDVFRVLTKDTPESDKYYTDGSTSDSVTCYNKGSGNVGSSDSVAVVLFCDNYVTTCNVEYRITATCMSVGDGDGNDGAEDGKDGEAVPTCQDTGVASKKECNSFCGGTSNYVWANTNGLVSCTCLSGLACEDVPAEDGNTDGGDGIADAVMGMEAALIVGRYGPECAEPVVRVWNALGKF